MCTKILAALEDPPLLRECRVREVAVSVLDEKKAVVHPARRLMHSCAA